MIDQNKESTSKNSNWRYLSKYLKAEDYVLLSEAEKILDISEHNKASYIKGRIFFFFLKKELKLYVLNLTSNKIDYSMSMDDFNGWHNIEELENKLSLRDWDYYVDIPNQSTINQDFLRNLLQSIVIHVSDLKKILEIVIEENSGNDFQDQYKNIQLMINEIILPNKIKYEYTRYGLESEYDLMKRKLQEFEALVSENAKLKEYESNIQELEQEILKMQLPKENIKEEIDIKTENTFNRVLATVAITSIDNINNFNASNITTTIENTVDNNKIKKIEELKKSGFKFPARKTIGKYIKEARLLIGLSPDESNKKN